MRLLFSILVIVTLLHQAYSTYSSRNSPVRPNTDEHLILTPLIEQNRIQQARDASQVHLNGFRNIKSYSGFLTVDKAFNSNSFFWFFPAKNNAGTAPVILWCEGGPAASAFLGLLGQNGPFSLQKTGLKLREHSWTTDHSVIYIDNPVGTGFSYTNGGYAQNQTKVGKDLYNALVQFFKLFPELQKNEFYIAGESFGGKYAPAVAYTIHQNNPNAQIKINLKGLTIGNGLCDPINQYEYGEYFYQVGLIDANERKQLERLEQQGIKLIQNKQFAESLVVRGNIFDMFANITGYDNIFNFATPVDPYNIIKKIEDIQIYVNRSEIRAALHVGKIPYNDQYETVYTNFNDDHMQSVAPWLEVLLNHYRVLFYNGQLDIILPYPLTVNFLKKMKFNGSDRYKTAVRHKWYVNSELAGYVKEAGKMTEVLVIDAGHLVPTDKPQRALDLIYRFTRNKSLY